MTDVTLTDGGDTFFANSDNAKAFWSEPMGMIYLRNPSMAGSGIMGLSGTATSPIESYYGG